MHHRLLQDQEGQVFLVDCEVQGRELNAALLIVDGSIESDWITLVDPCDSCSAYVAQLPQDVIHQSARYKGYECTLPCRQTA